MYVLTKVESGYEGNDVEVITASTDDVLVRQLETILNSKIKNDIDEWNNFKNVTYPLFLKENPKPEFPLDASVKQRVAMSDWMKKNTKIYEDFKSGGSLYEKDVSLSTLEATYYEITEVNSPENLLKALTSTV